MQKPTKAVVRARIEELLQIRLNGAQFWDVRQYAASKAKETGSPWFNAEGRCLTTTQLFRYIKRSDQLIEQSCRSSRKRLLRRHLAQRRNLYAKAVSQGDTGAALSIIKDEASLLHLYDAWPNSKKKADTKTASTTTDVVALLGERLSEIDAADLPTVEKARLSAALSDSLLRAIGLDTMEMQVEELKARLNVLTEKKAARR